MWWGRNGGAHQCLRDTLMLLGSVVTALCTVGAMLETLRLPGEVGAVVGKCVDWAALGTCLQACCGFVVGRGEVVSIPGCVGQRLRRRWTACVGGRGHQPGWDAERGWGGAGLGDGGWSGNRLGAGGSSGARLRAGGRSWRGARLKAGAGAGAVPGWRLGSDSGEVPGWRLEVGAAMRWRLGLEAGV